MVGREYPGEGAILKIFSWAYFIEYKLNKPKKLKKMAKCVFRAQPKKDKIWLHILFQPMEGEWRLGCPAKHHRGSTQI